jgi:Ice-binding-like/Bacterial Ig-like domain (group 3)
VLDRQAGRISPLTAVTATLLATGALVIGALAPKPALAATLPNLGTAASFAVLAASTATNTGPTVITGDLGLSPGTSVTGFPPGTLIGTAHVADAVASRAQTDLKAAYDDAAAQPPTANLTGQDLGGRTLTPGVYHFASSAGLTGTLTLDGQADPHAVFVFQMGSTLTTASDAQVVLTNGALASEVFWQVGSSATLGSDTALQGTVMALASITMVTSTTILSGRALALNAAVTMDTNRITVPPAACGAAPAPGCRVPTIAAITASSANPSTAGQPVTFMATVVAGGPVSGELTGTVTFRDGRTVLGRIPLETTHMASLTVPALAAGEHPIVAAYSGNPAFAPSRSHAFWQIVLAA